MKKYLLVAILALVAITAPAQISLNEQSEIQSLEDLSKRMKLGFISFGDTIALLYNDLTFGVDGDELGTVRYDVNERNLGLFRIGKYTPYKVMVFAKNWLVDTFVFCFRDSEKDGLKKKLFATYGKPFDEDNGDCMWIADNVCVMCQHTAGGYDVAFMQWDANKPFPYKQRYK